MQSRFSENCSLSEMRIQSRMFSCEDGFLPIFKRKNNDSVKNAFVEVTLNGIIAVPHDTAYSET